MVLFENAENDPPPLTQFLGTSREPPPAKLNNHPVRRSYPLWGVILARLLGWELAPNNIQKRPPDNSDNFLYVSQ